MGAWEYRRSDMDYTVGAVVDIVLGLLIAGGVIALIFMG